MIHGTDTIERIGHARPGRCSRGRDRDEGHRRGLFGLIGVVAGLMLSEIISIVGYLMFDSAVGIKFLPIYLGSSSPSHPPWMRGAVAGRNSRYTVETKGADHEEKQITFAFVLAHAWVLMIFFGALVFDTLIVYPNTFHDVPARSKPRWRSRPSGVRATSSRPSVSSVGSQVSGP